MNRLIKVFVLLLLFAGPVFAVGGDGVLYRGIAPEKFAKLLLHVDKNKKDKAKSPGWHCFRRGKYPGQKCSGNNFADLEGGSNNNVSLKDFFTDCAAMGYSTVAIAVTLAFYIPGFYRIVEILG